MATLRREHTLPAVLVTHCLLCGAHTRFSVDQLAEDGEGPLLDSPLLCDGCGNDLDARLERDLRMIARAAVSIRSFLPAGPVPGRLKREKSWGITVENRRLVE